MPRPYITRFAPSPTGYLHRGHAYAAWYAYRQAKLNNGHFILRIEDIDTMRCSPAFTDAVYEDLSWLGLEWETPVRCQSQHFSDYVSALQKLEALGVVYACQCSRKDILAANPEIGPEGVIYPGLCKHKDIDLSKPHALRLDLEKAIRLLKEKNNYPDQWVDEKAGPVKTEAYLLGDVVLKRKDTPTSYHLSVVVDDALQQVSHVIRGRDLWHSTHIHVILQALLGLRQPTYHHHELLVDNTGKKFAKSNPSNSLSETIRAIRKSGGSPALLHSIIP